MFSYRESRLSLTVKLVDHTEQVRIAEELTPEILKPLTDLVILALTPSRDLLSRWNGKQIDDKEKGHAFVAYTDFKGLPVHWKGYDSVDFFVIRGVSLVERRVSKRQQQALLDWIQRGGTLLVSGGADLHWLRGSFLEAFLPVALNPDLIGVEWGRLRREDPPPRIDAAFRGLKRIRLST